jgi:NADH-quinone oxidoreductase subunit A
MGYGATLVIWKNMPSFVAPNSLRINTMPWQPHLENYTIVLLFLAGGLAFLLGGLFLSKLLAPNRPNPEKLSTYECGEDPVGNARIQMNARFYVVALIFLIFDVEVLLLYPWATVYADRARIAEAPAWGWFALAEAAIFVVILTAGLAWVWARRDLDWVRPEPIAPDKVGSVPMEAYEAFNERQ